MFLQLAIMGIFSDIWQYMPHGMCLLWKPWLVLLWAGSDALIFTSYFAIPMALISVMRKRSEIPHKGLVLLFASFILLCGITHALSIVTLWIPIYPMVGFVKLATGIVSTTTAIVLFRLVPTLVSLPSPGELTEANANLKEEAAAHEKTLDALIEARDSLEAKVEARTNELRETNERLAVLAREAVHRSKNLLSVVTSLAQQSARGTDTTEEFLEAFHGRVQSLALATSTVLESSDKTSEELETVVRNQLQPLLMAFGERVEISGPSLRIGSEAAQQISLAVHELATNAQKYNLSQNSDATVQIAWSRTDDQSFEFCWKEKMSSKLAEGFANINQTGFGSKLLTRIVPAMLRGQASREIEADTFAYCLTAPLASVVPSKDSGAEEMLAARLVDDSFGLDSGTPA